MPFRSTILTILTLLLPACSGDVQYIPEGARICPERVWAYPEAQRWMADRVKPQSGDNLAIRIWLAQITRQQKQLDICNGNDPTRSSPYAEKKDEDQDNGS